MFFFAFGAVIEVEVHVNQQLFHWHRQLLDSAHPTEIYQMHPISKDFWLDVPDPELCRPFITPQLSDVNAMRFTQEIPSVLKDN